MAARNGVRASWILGLVLVAIGIAAVAQAQDERRGQMVGVYPTQGSDDCFGIYWQFMVAPPDRTRVYTQFGELAQSWQSVRSTSWNDDEFIVHFRDSSVQRFDLRMHGDLMTSVGFRCGTDGLTRLRLTDCDSGEPIADAFVSDTDTSRAWFRSHAVDAQGRSLVPCNCTPPLTVGIKVQKEGYVTGEAVWTFSGQRIDDQSMCLDKAGVPAAPSAPRHLGCFAERGDVDVAGLGNRDLDGHMFSDPAMTTEMCADACRERGYAYAGTQYGSYCFCGAAYGRTGPSSDCTMTCAGDASQICGGPYANSVYEIR